MFNKFVKEIKNAFIQGFTPEKIALSIAIGFIFGTVPFCISTFFCTISGIILRLNQPVIQLINFMVFPLQIILFIPYLKLGEFIFNEKTIPLNYYEIKEIFSLSTKLFILKLGKAIIYALSGWIILSPIFFVLLYFFSLYFLQKIWNLKWGFKDKI